MHLLSLLLILAGSQVAAAGDPYEVQDPFALEEAPPAAAAPAALTPQDEAVAEPSPEALICRSRPALGSRTRYFRNCMTALQWEHHDTNMEQQRRDINDMGAAGCDRNYVSSGCITQSLRPGT
jgi:hypothetical protein